MVFIHWETAADQLRLACNRLDQDFDTHLWWCEPPGLTLPITPNAIRRLSVDSFSGIRFEMTLFDIGRSDYIIWGELVLEEIREPQFSLRFQESKGTDVFCVSCLEPVHEACLHGDRVDVATNWRKIYEVLISNVRDEFRNLAGRK